MKIYNIDLFILLSPAFDDYILDIIDFIDSKIL